MLINSYAFGAANDPYRAQRTLILHGNGFNGSTTIIDSSPSPAVLTATGSATISTSTSASRFGGSSLSFLESAAGSIWFSAGSRLSFPGDFTIEVWAYFPQVPSSYAAIFEARSGANAVPFALGFRNTAGLIRPELYTGASAIQATNTVPVTTLTHVAWVRSGATLTTYINKTAAGTTTLSGSFAAAGSTIYIGRLPYDNTNATFFLDELVVTKAALAANEFAYDFPVPDF